MRIPDYVERRIVVEFGLHYVYLYITDGAGKLSDEESFKQPYRLERKECATRRPRSFTVFSTTR